MIILANTTYASVCLGFGGNAVWQGAIIGMARIHLSLRVCSITDSILDLYVEVDAVPKASDQFSSHRHVCRANHNAWPLLVQSRFGKGKVS